MPHISSENGISNFINKCSSFEIVELHAPQSINGYIGRYATIDVKVTMTEKALKEYSKKFWLITILTAGLGLAFKVVRDYKTKSHTPTQDKKIIFYGETDADLSPLFNKLIEQSHLLNQDVEGEQKLNNLRNFYFEAFIQKKIKAYQIPKCIQSDQLFAIRVIQHDSKNFPLFAPFHRNHENVIKVALEKDPQNAAYLNR